MGKMLIETEKLEFFLKEGSIALKQGLCPRHTSPPEHLWSVPPLELTKTIF